MKFVAVLSVVVLSVVAQGHEIQDVPTFIATSYTNYVHNQTQHVDAVISQATEELADSMNTVLQPAEGEITTMGTEEFISLATFGNVAGDLFKKLKGLIDTAFNKAREGIQFAKDKVNQLAEKAQNAAKGQIKGIADTLKKEVDAIKEKAKSAGIDIGDCLTGNEDRLLELPTKVSGELVHCVSDQVNKAISYADDALDQIQAVVNKVVNIKKDIDACGSGWKSFVCLSKLGVILAKDIVTLPLQIEAAMAGAVSSITQIQGKVTKCGVEKVTAMEKDGKEILTAITTCVAAKGSA